MPTYDLNVLVSLELQQPGDLGRGLLNLHARPGLVRLAALPLDL